MYGKHFASAYTGSMVGAGSHVFAVWGFVIATTQVDGHVELNPPILAAVLGCAVADVEAALAYLCAPDPNSRSKKEDGRRLIQVAPYLYTVPTHKDYREIRDDDGRREYMRAYMRTYRASASDKPSTAKVSSGKRRVSARKPRLAHTDTDTDTEVDAPTDTTPTGGDARTQRVSKPEPVGLPEPKGGKATWLTPYLDAWKARCGGDHNPGQLAKSLAPLRKTHGDAMTLTHWTTYLASTTPTYASAPRFVSTFGQWAPTNGASQIPAVDQYGVMNDAMERATRPAAR